MEDGRTAAAEIQPRYRWILETKNLTRIAGGLRLVDDVSLQVTRGEVVAIAGPSGSGKTSLLRLINRLDEPTAGTVCLEGRDYHEIPPRELRRRVGMVTQTAYLFPGDVAENLSFGPRQQGNQLSQAAIAELLEQVGLAGRAHSDASHLSGGEAQRVSLARALATSPAILLLDEPTSALDEEAKREIEVLILGIVRQHALTCLMVTHDLAQAARMASRIVMLKTGRLARNGSAREVLNAEAIL